MQSMTEAVGSSMRILVASVRSPRDLMSLASQVGVYTACLYVLEA